MAGKFIRFLPTMANSVIDCQVVRGSLKDAQIWDALVQPLIYGSASFQPDKNWNWPRLIQRTDKVERLFGRRSAYFQITTGFQGLRIPLGQILVSVGYPFLPNNDFKSVYLWFLAAPPLSFQAQFGIPKVKIMRALVDTAVQFSLMNGFDGRVCLHAVPCPSNPTYHNELFNKYKAIGLTPVPQSHLIMVKPNDGRYFFCDPQSRGLVTTPLDHLR